MSYSFPAHFSHLEEYNIFVEVVEVITGNDLLLLIGLPIGILLVAGLVLFITVYWFNAKFENSEQRELAAQFPSFYFSISPNSLQSAGKKKKAKTRSIRNYRDLLSHHKSATYENIT